MRSFSRLFALAPDCHAAGNRYAGVWQRHFYDGLQSAVPTVLFPREVDFTWARPAADAPERGTPERAEMSERLRRQIAAAKPNAVVSYCFATDIEPGLVRDTVAAGIPWVNFFCDSTYAFERVAPLAREASLNWFPESAAEPSYRALGRAWLCRPYAVNLDALPDAECAHAIHPVGFVGAARGRRALQLAGLAALGCRVEVRGTGWRAPPRAAPRESAGGVGLRGLVSLARLRAPSRIADRLLTRALRAWVRPGPPLDDAELADFVSRCRLVLGLNEGGSGRRWPRSYLKLRDVEFPGYGACYLTQHNEDVARAFDVGREVLTFGGLTEAAALVRDHTARPDLARAIGRAGRRRVLGEHTWTTRLSEIARAL
jgi:Glycosyl transferases group 1